ncbi:tetratricopeptide (TPR) repeat protein [Inquilinus ginsengisoli]|uniref:tetratricopeptide repeat protein n=1 Tax=Inquilinus ginsengisoli TaxID=363840 RepID=UPI003D23B467
MMSLSGLQPTVEQVFGAERWEALANGLVADRRYSEAADCYRQALAVQPDRRSARRSLAVLLVELGLLQESLTLWRDELEAGDDGLAWLQQLVSGEVQRRNIGRAGDYAAISAALRRASRWYPMPGDGLISDPVQRPRTFLSAAKLRHDIAQFYYLLKCGVLDKEFNSIIADLEQALSKVVAMDENARVPLEGEVDELIGQVYGRIVYLRPTPRLSRALSDQWDARAVENAYIDRPPGIVIIDNFLTDTALEAVRAFALQSTVWFANRYAYGRLGAFFHEGFACPLLVQIAEELRDAFPRVIGDLYPLRQLWGFKNCEDLPADATVHADFAAVNVNFWITPNDANLDPLSGGMVVYGVDAPSHWDFETYNGRLDIIKPFLKRQGAQSITIPYRQNRAIIFNSDLFHATSKVHFRSGYENHRINITMLYGDRTDDIHHRTRSSEHPSAAYGSWRSAAFRRSRIRRFSG